MRESDGDRETVVSSGLWWKGRRVTKGREARRGAKGVRKRGYEGQLIPFLCCCLVFFFSIFYSSFSLLCFPSPHFPLPPLDSLPPARHPRIILILFLLKLSSSFFSSSSNHPPSPPPPLLFLLTAAKVTQHTYITHT